MLRKNRTDNISVFNQKLEKETEIFLLLPLKRVYLQSTALNISNTNSVRLNH